MLGVVDAFVYAHTINPLTRQSYVSIIGRETCAAFVHDIIA